MKSDSWFASTGKVGILGGGQLGKMLLEEAIRMDITAAVMDPSAQCACSGITPEFVQGKLLDDQDVFEFGKTREVVTIEIENVSVPALEKLEENGVKVYPPSKVLKRIQDKGSQKEFYSQLQLPTSKYELFDSAQEVQQSIAKGDWSIPVVWKSRRGGYDGRGVQIIRTQEDLQNLPDVPCFLESLIDIKTEIACVGVRSSNGDVKIYPPVEMDFHPEANQVEETFVPSLLDDTILNKAVEMTKQLLDLQEHVGLLAVEFILDQDDILYVNEMAPRPHNSGHVFSDASWTSQFEQHLRAVMGLPLGETSLRQPGVMLNLVGEENYQGQVYYEGASELLREPGVYLHLYGKKETRPFRKMGHVNVVASTLEEARRRSADIRHKLKIISQ